MNNNFSKIKKKYFIVSVIASAVLGACCGIIVACLLAVVFKTNAIQMHWAIYIPIALVSGCGAGALLFLILRPNDKGVAKKLDRDFSLNQKTQTMVEFRNAEGAMVELQREQADEALAEIAVKRADLSFLLKFLVIPVLAVALFFAGIFVPAKKTTVPEEPPFNITDSQKTALVNLINDVKASALTVSLKDPTVEILNGLLDGLENEQPQSVMRKAVISSVKIIDGFFAFANTYGKLSSSFAEDEALKKLAYALVDGATFYIETGKTIRTFAQVTAKADGADQSVESVLSAFANEFLTGFMTGEEGEDPVLVTKEEASLKLSDYAGRIIARLEASVIAPKEGEKTDELYSVLLQFAGTLNTCAQSTSGYNTAEAYYGKIEGLMRDFYSVEGGLVRILSAQAYNCMMDEFIRNRLAEIFKLSTSDFGESDAITKLPDGDDDPDTEAPPGSPGIGGTSTASDDLVLDTEYDDGTQAKYNKVIGKYEQLFYEMVENGTCSAELEAYIRRYFDILYNNETPGKE